MSHSIIEVKMRRAYNQRSEGGQALVEYVLVLVLAVGVAVLIESITRRSIKKTWKTIAKEIAAPCPTHKGCIPPSSLEEP